MTPSVTGKTSQKVGLETEVGLASAPLAQQLPPLPKVSGGEQSQEEPFKEWIAQFELMAEVCNWSKRAKLIHLTTHLRGEAFIFYKSCSTQQKGDYDLLVAELTRRFTPVRIQFVQTSLFHDRKQKEKLLTVMHKTGRPFFTRHTHKRKKGVLLQRVWVDLCLFSVRSWSQSILEV